MKKLSILIASLILVGCSSPLRHTHTFYEYKIKYGNSLDTLDKELKTTCEAYRHPHEYEEKCPESINTIDGYTCALDNRLYLKFKYSNGATKPRHRTYSTSYQELDKIYCKIEVPIVSTKLIDLIDQNMLTPNVEKEVIINDLKLTPYEKYLNRFNISKDK